MILQKKQRKNEKLVDSNGRLLYNHILWERYDPLAQLVEHLTFNQGVDGSSPSWVTISGPLVKRLRHRPFTAITGVRFPHGSPNYGGLAQLGERLPYKQDVGGSIPSSPTIFSV